MTRRTLPNFLFIGADKSGSTWLYEVLRHHPECFVPQIKDIYFFDRYYSKGLPWYSSFFAHAPDTARAVGELSHDYLYSEEAAHRIRSTLPTVKLISFLRHPVERTFSEYLYLRRSGLVDDTFEEALTRHPEMIEHSRYSRYIRTYVELFGGSLAIFRFDDLQRDPADLARRVLAFLDLEDVNSIDYEQTVLPAAEARSARVARLARAAATAVRAAGAPQLVGKVKTSRVSQLLYRPYSPGERPRLLAEERALLHDLLDPDLDELEGLLGIDLRGWRRQPVDAVGA